jgi:pimeloyl-ACP methyl ester carboxylesterase
MTATATATAPAPPAGRIGVAVFGSIAAGLALGLVLSLVVFAGGSESEITGSALLALGAGFVALAVTSCRTSQPQLWAGTPGVVIAAAGLAVLALAPGSRLLGLAGWIWPVLLLELVAHSFVQARRSLRHWSRRAFLYPSLVVLLLVAVGGAFETVADAAAPSEQAVGPTYLVDGHRLYLSCSGHGSPTVVLFNGLGERTPSWQRVVPKVAVSHRVCVFDRAGEGRSGAAPGPQDGHQLALDLHGLLRAAHVPGPYVLGGHSVGGPYALVYAALYPEQVAGLALLDSSSPDQFDLPGYRRFYSMWRRVGAALPSLSRVGGRLFGASARELNANRIEFRELPRVLDQAKALRTLHGKPLAVVTADRDAMRGWQGAQNDLARLSTNSVHVHVAGATHATLLANEGYAGIASSAIDGVIARVDERASQR